MTKKPRPETILYMLMSIDGKISSGDVDERDFDIDLPNIKGLSEGLHQYYDLEKTTDIFSLNTGRTMAKIGANLPTFQKSPVNCSFVIIDNRPHLSDLGVRNLLNWVEHLYIVTTNSHHPAKTISSPKLDVIEYTTEINLPNLFRQLKRDYEVERITVQSGGTLNSHLIRAGLIDHLWIVITPALIGGATTSTLVDGPALRTNNDLMQIKTLRLIEATPLENSYLLLKYDLVTD